MWYYCLIAWCVLAAILVYFCLIAGSSADDAAGRS